MKWILSLIVVLILVSAGGLYWWAQQLVEEYAARDPADVFICEHLIKDRRIAPGTYIRANVERSEFLEDPRLDIAFDAQNSFGALLRMRATCVFVKPAPGAPDAALPYHEIRWAKLEGELIPMADLFGTSAGVEWFLQDIKAQPWPIAWKHRAKYWWARLTSSNAS